MASEPTTTALPPPPGSAASLALGCTCPVIDNAHGRGYMGRPGMFVYSAGCPVHGSQFGLPPLPKEPTDEH